MVATWVATRYEIPCRVRGTVSVGGETLTLAPASATTPGVSVTGGLPTGRGARSTSRTARTGRVRALRFVAPDGRVTHLPRALARVRTADGRNGVGWIEWNQNQPAGS